MPLVRKVGIEYTAKGNLEKTLKGFATSLKTAHTLSEKFRTSIATLGSQKTLAGLDKTVAAIDKIAAGVKAIKSVQVKLVSEQQSQTKATLDTLKARKAEAQALKAEEQAMQAMAKGEEQQARKKDQEANKERQRARQRAEWRNQAARAEQQAYEARLRRERQLTRQFARDNQRALQEIRARDRVQAKADQAEARRIARLNHERREARTTLLTLGTGSYWQAGQMVAGGLGDLVNNEAMRHYLIEKQGLVNMGLGRQQTAQAIAAGRQISYSGIQGLSHANEIDLVKDAILTFGKNPKTGKLSSEALSPATLRQIAKFSVAAGTTYGLNNGEVYKAAKVAELLTPNQKYIKDQRTGKLRLMTAADRAAAFSQSMNLEFKALGGLGGKVKPSELYQFMRRANAAKYGLTPMGLMHMLPIIQETGGSVAGRQLMSVEQNLANGRGLSSPAAKNLIAMGLLNPSMVHISKAGIVSQVQAGALKGDKELREDPFAWYEKYLAPKLKGKSMAEAQRTVSSILNNRTAMSLIMTYFAQDARIHKDTALAVGAMGVNASYVALQKSYPMAVRNFEKAWQRLQVDLGSTMLPTITNGLNALAAAIEGLDKAASKHPTLAKGVLGAGAAVGGTLLLAGGIQGAKSGVRLVRNAFGFDGKALAAGEGAATAEAAVGGEASTLLAAGLAAAPPIAVAAVGAAAVAAIAGGLDYAMTHGGPQWLARHLRWAGSAPSGGHPIVHLPGWKASRAAAKPAYAGRNQHPSVRISSWGHIPGDLQHVAIGAFGSLGQVAGQIVVNQTFNGPADPDTVGHHTKEAIRQAMDEHAHSMLLNQPRMQY